MSVKDGIIAFLVAVNVSLAVYAYSQHDQFKTAMRVNTHMFWALSDCKGRDVSFEEMEQMARSWWSMHQEKKNK
ncbi:Uncharacterised protein [uncultured archaeon]|nr:Uncharacterised protein [uncultured archaeon]